VENSLDAAESIGVLPEIEVQITQLSPASFAELCGVAGISRGDETLYKKESGKGAGKDQFFKVSCRDNGCGMLHNQVPNMFGRVLAGSKYGVKQARGKFGLGAKMALIWSKKSTGLPIEITTAHVTKKGEVPQRRTYCKLDIDIHKNEPKVHTHEYTANSNGWHGTQVDLVISGGWTTYKRRIQDYLQQLAVITPYAHFKLEFVSETNPKHSCTFDYARRSEQMGNAAKEVKFHPESVNNLIVRQLLGRVNAKMTLKAFLRNQFSCISKDLAEKHSMELETRTDGALHGDLLCKAMTDASIQQLTHFLHEAKFPPPDASCLSPAGEYNLNLGILKEFKPKMVATAVSKPGAYAGHPFLVEAAVALTVNDRNPGISTFRFANRIPLLFEAGNDVVHVVTNQIKWAQYLINPKADKIMVFGSIVSTKIPFKGTGKEYIGADIQPMYDAVLDTIRSCAQQLKKAVHKGRQDRDRDVRLKSLKRYIPDVARAFVGILEQSRAHAAKRAKLSKDPSGTDASPAAAQSPSKHSLIALERELCDGDALTVAKVERSLESAMHKSDMNQAMEEVKKRGRGEAARENFFLVPATSGSNASHMTAPVLTHPVVALRLHHAAEINTPVV